MNPIFLFNPASRHDIRYYCADIVVTSNRPDHLMLDTTRKMVFNVPSLWRSTQRSTIDRSTVNQNDRSTLGELQSSSTLARSQLSPLLLNDIQRLIQYSFTLVCQWHRRAASVIFNWCRSRDTNVLMGRHISTLPGASACKSLIHTWATRSPLCY